MNTQVIKNKLLQFFAGKYHIQGPNLPGHRRDWGFNLYLKGKNKGCFWQDAVRGHIRYCEKNQTFRIYYSVLNPKVQVCICTTP